MLRNLLQGKPFGAPLHTMLVHFPIGLFALSLLLDALSWLRPGAALLQAASYVMAAGVVAALLAAVPGVVDWDDIRADHPAKRPATIHMVLNLTAVSLYAFNVLALRPDALGTGSTPLLPLAFSLAGLGLLGVSGYLGGKLVYEEGVAVGRHRRWTDTPVETLSVTQAALDGWVTVAPTADLAEGETLRADLDGVVVAVARLDGQYYAFQGFCTHRYGPLSEGRLHDGQVQCPWHASCFDMRTGQPTQGPAKVALNTYRVMVSDGKILVDLRQSAAVERERLREMISSNGRGQKERAGSRPG
jgi:nitrite reductase/ring-hydroxylating ferredoxin subunit/uncharacterized membrane protein